MFNCTYFGFVNSVPAFHCFSRRNSLATSGMKPCSLLLLSVFCLAGCSTPASKINDIRIGMTKSEVLAVMGPPVSITADPKAEYLNYSLAEGRTGPDQPVTPYEVKLVNGRVESYGRAGSPNAPHSTTIVPQPVIIPR